MVRRTRSQFQNVVVAAIIVATVALLAPGPSGANHQTVTAVQGSAYGYRGIDLLLFPPAQQIGPTPAVTLAPDASNSPQSAAATTALIRFAPATIFSADDIAVSTSGTLGPNGSVTSNASLENVGRATTQPTTGSEVLEADLLQSTCTASESVLSGSTTVTNGRIRTDSGFDVDQDGVFEPAQGDLPEVFVNIPAGPLTTPFETTGIVRFDLPTGQPGDTSFDTFRIVINEQVRGPGQSITVNAAHIFYAEPGTRLNGELILGQVVCGVTLQDLPATTTTTTQGVTTTTQGVTTTTQGVTTTTQGGVTTTTQGGVTTTTQPGATTTTSTVFGTTTTAVTPTTPTTVVPRPNIPTLIRQILCPLLARFAAIPFFRPFILRFLVIFGCPIP